MTQFRPDIAYKALADFWADMGFEEARLPGPARAASRAPAARGGSPSRPAARAGTGQRPEPRRLANNPVAEARRLASGANTLAELKSAIEKFEGCPLKAAAKNTVVCDGAFDAQVMIVGEAPGGEEDSKGLPFVGRAGKLLDRMLA